MTVKVNAPIDFEVIYPTTHRLERVLDTIHKSIAALDHPPGSRPTGRPAERRSAPHAHQVTNYPLALTVAAR